MKRIAWFTLLVSILVFVTAGCGSAADTTPIPPVSLPARGASEPGQIHASAVVTPALESRLSFLIPGMVAEVTVAEGDQVQAGQVLVKLDTTDLEYEIVAAQAALTAAETEAEVQRLPRKRINFEKLRIEYVSAPGEMIQEAESRAEQRRWALEAAKATLAQGTLVAPFAGTVVEVNVSPGEYVQPSQVVIVIATLEDLQVETTDLSELNVAAVKNGQPATVFVEALGQAFPGQVSAISPISDTVGGDVVFKVTLELEEQPEALRWGMSADVEINVE